MTWGNDTVSPTPGAGIKRCSICMKVDVRWILKRGAAQGGYRLLRLLDGTDRLVHPECLEQVHGEDAHKQVAPDEWERRIVPA